MGTLIIYYSYTGNTHKYAVAIAKTENADIYEIKDSKRPSNFKSFTKGCYKALSRGTFPIEKIDIDFSKYDKIIICAPIWAGNPAPQVNNLFDIMPKGKAIDMRMVSSSGEGSKKQTIQWIESKGYKVTNYKDIKKGDLL